MSDKEIQNSNKEQKFYNSNKRKESLDKLWSFCPVCGNKIPKIQNLKFCFNCGTDLNYLKEQKQLNPNRIINSSIQANKYPQAYVHPVSNEVKKIFDNEITNTKNHKLWGTMPSIGISLGAFLVMNFITAGIVAIMVFFSFNLEALLDFIANPNFLIFSSFFELILVLFPVLYVGKYLKNPSLKNRFGLLGFTLKGFTRKGLFKEILIGLGFAVIGVLLVAMISFLTEITLEFFFGVEIIRELANTTSDLEILVPEGEIVSLILLSVVMILIIGTSEEILFRGFMQKGLMRTLGNIGGIMITAFIFAMIHVFGIVFLFLDSPIYMLISFLLSFFPYFIISLFLGLIYYWRNENLIAVILTHGVYNALTIIITYVFYYGF